MELTRTETRVPNAKRQWWAYEVWEEQRDTFKVFAAHVLQFLLVIGSLAFVGWVLDKTVSPLSRKAALEDIDFYALLIVFCLLAIGLVAKCSVVALNEILNQ